MNAIRTIAIAVITAILTGGVISANADMYGPNDDHTQPDLVADDSYIIKIEGRPKVGWTFTRSDGTRWSEPSGKGDKMDCRWEFFHNNAARRQCVLAVHERQTLLLQYKRSLNNLN